MVMEIIATGLAHRGNFLTTAGKDSYSPLSFFSSIVDHFCHIILFFWWYSLIYHLGKRCWFFDLDACFGRKERRLQRNSVEYWIIFLLCFLSC
jgi:hypothetical protein